MGINLSFLDYRAEIDGLRAVAVISVIFYHAGFKFFNGGFVGVDIFFVISGYLITNIIVHELEQGKFSLSSFYERRARRILPALFFVIAACIPFAWCLLLPSEMKFLSKSIAASVLFSSNIVFLRESSYFDVAAELKPMLHTWSLAVEEQFYIVFPFIMLSIWKFGKKNIIGFFLVLIGGGLLLAQLGSIGWPQSNFFLLPTRFWEILTGSVIALYLKNKLVRKSSRLCSELYSLAGFSIIIFSVFYYSSQVSYPSVYTILPVAGVALVLLFCTSETFLFNVLSNRFLVGIGILSYSAYLWHQPVFAFTRYAVGEPLGAYWYLLLCIIVFLLSFLTWKYIETPFKKGNSFKTLEFTMLMFLISFSLIVFGVVGYKLDGFDYRLSQNQQDILNFSSYRYQSIYREGTCFLKPEQSSNSFSNDCLSANSSQAVLVWGDSHAAALSFGIRNINPFTIQYTASGCPPFIGQDVLARPMCRDVNDFIAIQIVKFKPKKIVLHANWALYREQNPMASIQTTIDFIRVNIPSASITIVGGVPQFYPSLPRHMYKQKVALLPNSHLKSYLYSDVLEIDRNLAEIAERNDVQFFSAVKAMCRNEDCKVTAEYQGKLMLTAWDYGHLTAAGSMLLAEKLLSD